MIDDDTPSLYNSALSDMTPSNERETRLLLNTAFAMDTPAAVRYPRGKGPGTDPGEDSKRWRLAAR